MSDISRVSVQRVLGSASVLAIAAALMAGCGTKPTPGSQSRLSASQAIALAAHDAGQIRSLSMTETVRIGLPKSLRAHLPAGVSLPGSQFGSTIRMTMQFKPTLLAELRINVGGIGPRSTVIEEILTAHAIYVRAPGLTHHLGKPWGKVNLSSLPHGMTPANLLAKLQANDPLAAGPAAVAKLLRAARNLKVVGRQVVSGVPTTEYAGTISLRALAALMAGGKYGPLGSAPTALRRHGLPFRVWIDAQHQLRKLALTIAQRETSISLTALVTAINQPVHIVPPPASKVAVVHKL